jgi:PAP2 superfamily
VTEFGFPDSERSAISRRTFLVAGGSLAAAGLPSLGARDAAARLRASAPASAYSAEVPAAWFELALDLVRTTPGFSAPVAARAFGYAGVTLYEAVVPGIPGRRSLAGRLNGLARLPCPADVAYHWPTVANSALAHILRCLFPTDSDLAAIDALEHRFVTAACGMLPHATCRRSVARGASVARHIFSWSRSDGGHEGFLNNFPLYAPPRGAGLWEPTPPAFLPALQPYWGSNRPFLPRSCTTCSPDPPPTYSDAAGSAFYAEARECYDAATHLTPEQEAIVRFWADDPGTTATPPGHSISILTQVVRALDLSLASAADTYAKLGVAVADAFISCWSAKYRYNLLRPVTYIRRVIDPDWIPLLVTPPFPEYTSGHSVQSAAAAQVLTDLLGRVAFTDRTNETRGIPGRSFASFMDAAREAAFSRMSGGIHFRAAIDRGLEEGICIGRRVRTIR